MERQRDAWAEHGMQREEGQVHGTSLRRIGVDARLALGHYGLDIPSKLTKHGFAI